MQEKFTDSESRRETRLGPSDDYFTAERAYSSLLQGLEFKVTSLKLNVLPSQIFEGNQRTFIIQTT